LGIGQGAVENLALSKAVNPDPAFWAGQRVLLTGHTGFKGAWTALWLERLGATVHGFALAPDHVPDLYSRLAPIAGLTSTIADLADRRALAAVVVDLQPTIVLHMAAQPLVRQSYADPLATFATNVMGTAHVLDAVRNAANLKAVLIVTTDKVYANDGAGTRFAEGDRLGSGDPYSASKACAELITASYRHSFFKAATPVATARAGNVIGGGDWSADRLIPDIWRALHAGRPIELRYPQATRPWQHVLDPVAGYLVYLEHLALSDPALPSTLNFGPAANARAVTVAEVADVMAEAFGMPRGWQPMPGDHPHEMATLALDASLATTSLGWRPRLDAATALRWTADWYRGYDAGRAARSMTIDQIDAYEALA
jgi:CDP-glucose 4,6-dehydratase